MADKKVWFITGAGRGMGVDFARAALAAGHAVAATGRNTAAVAQAVGASDDLLVVTLDITSLASLTAGSISATGGLARVLGEKGDFSASYNEGDKDNLYMIIVAARVILVVTFNNETSSLGLVRLRVKKAADELTLVIQRIVSKSATGSEQVLSEITDDDIDNLFS